MPSDPIVAAALATGLTAAVVADVRTRRIPNALTVPMAAAGLAAAASGTTGLTLSAAVAGAVLGLLLMLPGYVFGATGGGDVKLFAAIGALLGPAPIALAFFYTALAGGVLALVVAVRRRTLRPTLEATTRFVASRAGNAAEIEAPQRNNRFAYAPAIAVGTLLAAFGA